MIKDSWYKEPYDEPCCCGECIECLERLDAEAIAEDLKELQKSEEKG